MLGRRLVYECGTEVILRQWVDTTYLNNGVETPYFKNFQFHVFYNSNVRATYYNHVVSILSNNTWKTAYRFNGNCDIDGYSENIYFSDTLEYVIKINTVYRIIASYTNLYGVYESIPVYIVVDCDGNIYNLTKIGTQWWTCENMRAIHYSDGTALTNGGTQRSETIPYYYEYIQNGENLFAKAPLLGRLYNWPAATMSSDGSSDVNIQGLAPVDFHIPNDNEWQTMINVVSNGYFGFAARLCDNRYYKQFPSTGLTYNQYYKWEEAYFDETPIPGNYNANNRNNSMLSIVPAGIYSYDNYYYLGSHTYFWSATQNNTLVYWRGLYYLHVFVNHNEGNKHLGYSVRCICDYDLDTIQ